MIKILYSMFHKISMLFHSIERYGQIKLMAEFGDGSHLENGCNMNWENVHIGKDVHIGENNKFMCSRAPIIIGDHVMFGPNVTLITGDHRYDIKGKYMTEIDDSYKRDGDDLPIVFEGDNWICANAIILKGVTIGKGAIVGAGAVVNKSVPAYSIVGGVPAKVISRRFEDDVIEEHERIVLERQSNRR